MKQTKTTSTDVRQHVTKLNGIRIGRRQAWCLLVAALFAAAATVLAAEALDRGSAANTTAPLTPAPLGEKPVLASPQEKIRAELVTAFPYGFEPDELTRPEGPFMLCVDNRAGTEALSLQLISGANGAISGANGAISGATPPVYAAPIQRGKSGTHKMLNLAPGQYVLREGSHPRWFCTITITPR